MESDLHLTKRMERIIKLAETEVEITECNVMMPVHLLLACLQEKTGALGEIFLKSSLEAGPLREMAKKDQTTSEHDLINSTFFTVPIKTAVKDVLDVACAYMERYNQIYLNEGHLLRALVNSKEMERYLTSEDKKTIIDLGTTARDMITYLGDYTFPNVSSRNIRKADTESFEQLVSFVEKHFSKEWAKTVNSAATLDNPPIYVAYDHEEEIIGFATYDLYQNKKCYFGPMGVSKTNRIKGIGYALLHHCLRDMKQIGYEYAIIGGAGPIEYYEQVCDAVVIPAPIMNTTNTK